MQYLKEAEVFQLYDKVTALQIKYLYTHIDAYQLCITLQ